MAKQTRSQAKNTSSWMPVIVFAILALLVIVAATTYRMVAQVALPAEIANLSAIEENWIVIDTDRTVNKRYHHPASYDVQEGYTKTSFATRNDGIQQDFFITADSPDALVESIMLSATANLSAREYIARVGENRSLATASTNTTAALGEPFQHTFGGRNAHCCSIVYTKNVEGAEPTAYNALYTAFDAPGNVCVYACFSSPDAAPDAVCDTALLLQEAERLLVGLTIMD